MLLRLCRSLHLYRCWEFNLLVARIDHIMEANIGFHLQTWRRPFFSTCSFLTMLILGNFICFLSLVDGSVESKTNTLLNIDKTWININIDWKPLVSPPRNLGLDSTSSRCLRAGSYTVCHSAECEKRLLPVWPSQNFETACIACVLTLFDVCPLSNRGTTSLFWGWQLSLHLWGIGRRSVGAKNLSIGARTFGCFKVRWTTKLQDI